MWIIRSSSSSYSAFGILKTNRLCKSNKNRYPSEQCYSSTSALCVFFSLYSPKWTSTVYQNWMPVSAYETVTVCVQRVIHKDFFFCLSETPFLEYFSERIWAEHHLRDAEKSRTKCQLLPETNSPERKLKKKALKDADCHANDIKEEIKKLETGQPDRWNKKVAELTKHFFHEK